MKASVSQSKSLFQSVVVKHEPVRPLCLCLLLWKGQSHETFDQKKCRVRVVSDLVHLILSLCCEPEGVRGLPAVHTASTSSQQTTWGLCCLSDGRTYEPHDESHDASSHQQSSHITFIRLELVGVLGPSGCSSEQIMGSWHVVTSRASPRQCQQCPQSTAAGNECALICNDWVITLFATSTLFWWRAARICAPSVIARPGGEREQHLHPALGSFTAHDYAELFLQQEHPIQ